MYLSSTAANSWEAASIPSCRAKRPPKLPKLLRIAMRSGSVKDRTWTFSETELSFAASAVTVIVPQYSPGAASRGTYTCVRPV